MRSGNGGKEASRLFRFAAELIGQDDRLITQGIAGFGGGKAQILDTSGNGCLHVIQFFWCFDA